MTIVQGDRSRWSRERLAAPLGWVAFHLAVGVVFAFAASHGTWKMLGPEFLGSTFDELGRSLLRGEVTVPYNHESFLVDGRPVVYFGAFPAFLRIPANLLFPVLFGGWSRLSCLAAALVGLAAFLRLVSLAFGGLTTRFRTGVALLLGLGWAFGSPILFLVSQPYVYHEAILWGLAGSLVGMGGALAMFRRPGHELRDGTVLAAGFLVALLTRVTFGIPLGLLILLSALVAVGREPVGRGRRLRTFLAANLLAVAAVGFSAWYNFARWGSPFRLIDQSSYVIFHEHPQQMEVVRSYGNFDPMRIPNTTWNYFALRPESFSRQFPWFRLAGVRYSPAERFIEYREWTISLLASAPWLVLLALAGLVLVVRRRQAPPAVRLAPFAFLPQTMMVLTFYFVSERYIGDLLPLIVAVSFLAIERVAEAEGGRERRLVAGGLLALVAVSIVVTATSTLHWMAELNWGADPRQQETLRQLLAGLGSR